MILAALTCTALKASAAQVEVDPVVTSVVASFCDVEVGDLDFVSLWKKIMVKTIQNLPGCCT